jgi:hypothetical protein
MCQDLDTGKMSATRKDENGNFRLWRGGAVPIAKRARGELCRACVA